MFMEDLCIWCLFVFVSTSRKLFFYYNLLYYLLNYFFLFVEYIFKVVKSSSYSLSFRVILSCIRKFCSTLNFLKIVLEIYAETNLLLKNVDRKTFTFLLESK